MPSAPKISMRTLLLAVVAVAMPIALHQGIPGMEPALALVLFYGTLVSWTLTGASLGNDNGRSKTGAVVGFVLFFIWAFVTLIPEVH